MFRAIGTILLLIFLSRMFESAFVSLEQAAIAIFSLIEISAQTASVQIETSQ